MSDSDRTFIGGHVNGMSPLFTSGDGPDPKMIALAASRLGREQFYVDKEGFERDIFAATVHPDGKRIVYLESRAKRCERFLDITIKINYFRSNAEAYCIDIESYNPFFGCDVGFLNWINKDVSLLIYKEKHWTFAYRIADRWPPEFVKIEERWKIKEDVLSYMPSKADMVKRLRIPSLEQMAAISVTDAERNGTLPPVPKLRP